MMIYGYCLLNNLEVLVVLFYYILLFMNKVKNFIILCLVLLLFVSVTYAWTNKIYLLLKDDNNNNILNNWYIKYFCSYTWVIKYNYDHDPYKWFSLYLNYPYLNIDLLWSTSLINSQFDQWLVFKPVHSWSIYLLNIQWWRSETIQWNIDLASFWLDILNTWIFQFNLTFYDKDYNIWQVNADPQDNFLVWRWWNDSIEEIENATYNLYAYPCTVDTTRPTITGVSSWSWQRYIVWITWLTFLTYDKWWSNVSYWFSGTDYSSTWVWYIARTSLYNVDNQEWVDKNNIKVKLTCTGCIWTTWWTSDWVVRLSWWNLSFSWWWWDTTIYEKTWNNKDRWTYVTFSGWQYYGIEKQVNVEIYVPDNVNFDVHDAVHSWKNNTWIWRWSFNSADKPSLLYSWSTTEVFTKKGNTITFKMSDKWAWINTWTLKLYVSYWYTWDDELWIDTWYQVNLDSWAFVKYKWDYWTWNSWSYYFSFYPVEDFPANSIIRFTWYVYDLVWNKSDDLDTHITTMQACSYYHCYEPFTIINWGVTINFTWIILYITWTRLESPYPYLTWENNEILMCGVDWTWIVFNTWSAWNLLVDNSDNYDENGRYNAEILNITWADFTVEKDENGKLKIKID